MVYWYRIFRRKFNVVTGMGVIGESYEVITDVTDNIIYDINIYMYYVCMYNISLKRNEDVV